jgi:hypothetical protein
MTDTSSDSMPQIAIIPVPKANIKDINVRVLKRPK